MLTLDRPERAPGQWKLLDVVDANHLSYAEATEVLQRLHVAEARHGIQQLNRSGGKPWNKEGKYIQWHISCSRTQTASADPVWPGVTRSPSPRRVSRPGARWWPHVAQWGYSLVEHHAHCLTSCRHDAHASWHWAFLGGGIWIKDQIISFNLRLLPTPDIRCHTVPVSFICSYITHVKRSDLLLFLLIMIQQQFSDSFLRMWPAFLWTEDSTR